MNDRPRCDYCGDLGWTVERYGRTTHKEFCPHRNDPWHQAEPMIGDYVRYLERLVRDRGEQLILAREQAQYRNERAMNALKEWWEYMNYEPAVDGRWHPSNFSIPPELAEKVHSALEDAEGL